MRVVVALGGNALLRRGEPMTAENQRANVKKACEALAPVANDNEIVISHGNGPQVGLIALQQSAYAAVEPYPLDVLGAQTEGMIGYIVEQELGNLLPFERPFATILSMTEVDPADPAFGNPTKPIGPVYGKDEADRMAADKGWTFKADGNGWRRVVPSPRPKRIFEIRPVKWLLEKGTVVVFAGGGGIPTMYGPGGVLTGIEAVIDKDLASSLLAREVAADAFVMATDADAVYLGWGTPEARALKTVSTAELRKYTFPAGSMGPKVQAACEFAEATGKPAAIGALEDSARMLRGEAGTTVVRDAVETEYWPRRG
ncbi:MAG: carbamate kinase [Thermoanaerobaculia bacterium]